MDKVVLIGTVTLEKDQVMCNTQFQYAASFEELLVPKGEYPVYAYEGDLNRNRGDVSLGWRNYIGYEGTVLRGNIGNKIGDRSRYDLMVYDYTLAEHFLKRHGYWDLIRYDNRMEWKLDPHWTLKLEEWEYEGKRKFSVRVVRKDV